MKLISTNQFMISEITKNYYDFIVYNFKNLRNKNYKSKSKIYFFDKPVFTYISKL